MADNIVTADDRIAFDADVSEWGSSLAVYFPEQPANEVGITKAFPAHVHIYEHTDAQLTPEDLGDVRSIAGEPLRYTVTRVVRKPGGSLAVTLPSTAAEAVGIEKGDHVTVLISQANDSHREF